MSRALLVASLLLACTRADGGGDAKPTSTAPPTATPPPATEPFARDDRAAVAAAMKQAGAELTAEDCVTWPTSFPRVVAVGSFAHDRGCDLTGVFVDRRWLAGGASVDGLATRGFAGASAEERQTIARQWVEEVDQAFGGRFVSRKPTAFEFPEAPAWQSVEVRADGQDVVVEGWIEEPSGMRWEDAFRFVTYRFAPDGKLAAEVKQRFSIEGERIQAHEAARAAKGAG